MKKQVKRGFRRVFVRGAFLSSVLLSLTLVIVKLYIPEEYEFIEPISLYGSILSSVIFIYWFILSPAMNEYKESERILSDVQNSLGNIESDAHYYSSLSSYFDEKKFHRALADMTETFYHMVADDTPAPYLHYIDEMNEVFLTAEKNGLPPNHIIRTKNEISILKKSFIRIEDIKSKDAVPKMIHHLKNFVTFMVIATLFFLNIGNDLDGWILSQIEELFMLFLISFLYIFLSFIISGFDNPFDKRRFAGYIDISFMKEYAMKLRKNKQLDK